MRPHKLKAAFLEDFNLIGMGAALALSAATLNPLPLLVAVAAEAAYLLFVPDSKWFERRLDHKYDQEIIRRREDLKREVFPQIRTSARDRFARLESVRSQIEAQAKNEDRWFREAMRKLDFLMEKYLQFALKEAHFCSYLRTLERDIEGVVEPPPVQQVYTKGKDRRKPEREPQGLPEPTEKFIDSTVNRIQGHYNGEIQEIDDKITEDPDFPTRRVVEKRKEILQRRHEYVGRIGLILHNLGGQMQLMQDTFGLINDEIRARSPEQVLADIDEVVITSNSLTDAIEEVASLEDLVARL